MKFLWKIEFSTGSGDQHWIRTPLNDTKRIFHNLLDSRQPGQEIRWNYHDSDDQVRRSEKGGKVLSSTAVGATTQVRTQTLLDALDTIDFRLQRAVETDGLLREVVFNFYVSNEFTSRRAVVKPN